MGSNHRPVFSWQTRKKGVDTQLSMYGQRIEQVKVIRFWKVWFDTQLTWNEHIHNILSKCKTIINVIRRLTEWGVSRLSMRNIYVALVKSLLDNGCIAYGSALIKKLEVVQAQALRLCCVAFKTSPVSTVQVEMGEMPLHLRRKQLKMNY